MQEESALKILEAGRHAEALSQKMMDVISLSKQPELTKTAVKSTELKRIIEDFFPGKTAFQLTTDTVYGDQTLLISLLTNLVQNAIRASAENDVAEVSISEEEQSTLIQVTDHGRGIPKEHLPYLTDPFYRVDKARSRKEGGAGLGLTLCSMIAEAHGGDFLMQHCPFCKVLVFDATLYYL